MEYQNRIGCVLIFNDIYKRYSLYSQSAELIADSEEPFKCLASGEGDVAFMDYDSLLRHVGESKVRNTYYLFINYLIPKLQVLVCNYDMRP